VTGWGEERKGKRASEDNIHIQKRESMRKRKKELGENLRHRENAHVNYGSIVKRAAWRQTGPTCGDGKGEEKAKEIFNSK